ncbi:uncharacterized protein PFLUO_LOCUS6857 [Penicillium psychrofluorescens]|uniref:uncharacterized protein n=1 Tax=Penicillium psychrofluorescens TaxID=3158075 RepID=UPI003CCD9355
MGESQYSSPSLTSLPVEIQCDIYEQLDPIDLISISQTNSRLRSLINPSKRHFVERLVALETQEKHGGVALVVNITTGRPDSAGSRLEYSECKGMRWACAECLRLLPHTAFEDPWLLRLCYRKPIPGSPADLRTTSWNRSGKVARSRFPRRDASEEKRLRRRHNLALSYDQAARIIRVDKNGDALEQRLAELQKCGMAEFENMTLAEFLELDSSQEQEILRREAHLMELNRCGFKRCVRKCNECRYQRGQLEQGGRRLGGTDKVPILLSLPVFFPSVTDRYFPNLSDVLENKRPASYLRPITGWHGGAWEEEPWPTHTIRCPGCSQWQETRHFRLGEMNYIDYRVDWPLGLSNWDEQEVTRVSVDKLRCNRCFVQESGREAFGTEFLRWLKCVLASQRDEFECTLRQGFDLLYDWSRSEFCSDRYRDEIEEIVREPRIVENSGNPSESDLTLFRERHKRWLALKQTILIDDQILRLGENDTFSYVGPHRSLSIWEESYDQFEAMYRWLKAAEVEVAERVEVVIDWALVETG